MVKSLEKVYTVTKSKDFKNILILVIAVIAVLAINSLLPLLEGGSHYTEQSEEYSYSEFRSLQQQNSRYVLTPTYKIKVESIRYKAEEKADENNIADTERKDYINNYMITHIDTVEVYTKFFFESPTWWINMILNALSVVLIYYACFNFMISKLKRKRKDYIDLKEEVNTAVQTQVDPVTFEPFNEDFNLKRKIKQHISNVKCAKDRLIRKTSYKVRVGMKAKKHKIYKQKIEDYDNQLTSEYINTYVKDKKIKHFKYIYPTFVMSGYNAIGNSVDSYSLIVTDSAKIGKDGIKKTIIGIMLTVVLAVLLTFTIDASIDKTWYWILANILAKITPLIFQVVMAYDYSETFMDEQLINNLISRRSIILLYLAGVKDGKQNQ